MIMMLLVVSASASEFSGVSSSSGLGSGMGSGNKRKVVKRRRIKPSLAVEPEVPTDAAAHQAQDEWMPKKKKKKASSSNNNNLKDGMPSLFSSVSGGDQYDRYAACLAATEGLRRARDAAASGNPEGASSSSSMSTFSLSSSSAWRRNWFSNANLNNPYAVHPDSEEYKRAYAQYVLNSSRVIRALGLSVSQFNQLGREINNDPELKEKVMEQAYLYRMAATLSMDRIPLIEDPSSEQLLRARRRERVQMFARSMTDIEVLRAEQQEKLKRALNVDRLPEGINICDPAILPILSPKVRAVCEAFPLQAEEIVKKYGLNSDEFNQMLQETRGNPIFRWRVKKYMGKTTQ